MTKEKKIVESTIKLQQFLFKYKTYCRELPKEINKKQSFDLILESAKCLVLCRKQEEQLLKLISSVKPDLISKLEIEKFSAENDFFQSIVKLTEINNKESDS